MAWLLVWCWGDGGLRIRPGSLLANEQRETRERKTACDVVDYVYLTEIEARLKGLQRDINLEDDGFAIGCGDFVGDDGQGLVNFRCALEKFDAGEDSDGIARRLRRRRRFRSFCLGNGGSRGLLRAVFPFRRIVDFVLQIKMLI